MTRPIKVNLKDPKTWPKGWKPQPFDPERIAHHRERVELWWGKSLPREWAPSETLRHGDWWLPRKEPPPPRSRKWRTK